VIQGCCETTRIAPTSEERHVVKGRLTRRCRERQALQDSVALKHHARFRGGWDHPSEGFPWESTANPREGRHSW